MPSPDTQYKMAPIRMSRQFRSQPQANGIAVMRAHTGRKTNPPTKMRCGVVFGFSSSKSPAALRRIGAALGSTESAVSSLMTSVLVLGLSGVLAMFSPEIRRPQAATLYAYVTVAYETVGCARVPAEILENPC